MITVEFKQDGQLVGLMTADPKEFKTSLCRSGFLR
jgi:hypothetical protein